MMDLVDRWIIVIVCHNKVTNKKIEIGVNLFA